MSLSIDNDPHSPQVTPTSHHHQIPHIKLDTLCNLSRGNVDSDSVIDLDLGVRVADGTAIVSHAIRDTFLASIDTTHFSQFVLQWE